ncbi:tetratricopeptide repeat protein [Gynuella sp.]|uniref:tetratricopeptide repeat protein n=1 Tax=Gynuella sp. TaxID=2969146 RepID=UPI003D10A130
MLVKQTLMLASYTLLSVLVASCASQEVAADTPPPVADQTVSATQPEQSLSAKQSLDGQTIYSVLTAEMAIDRGEYPLAGSLYYHLAEETRDAGAAKKAANIAQMLGDMKAAKAASKIWLESEPDNVQANQSAALASIRLGELDDAKNYLERTLALNPKSSAGIFLSDTSAFNDEDLRSLQQLITGLTEQYNDNASLWFSDAELKYHLSNTTGALESINHSLKLQRTIDAYLLKAQILFRDQQDEKAIATLDQALKAFPLERRIVVYKTQQLSRLERPADAIPTLQDYLEQNTDDAPIMALLARIAIDADEPELARSLYLALEQNNTFTNEAHYYLARLDENNGDIQSTMQHLKRITPSEYYIPAVSQRVQILMTEQKVDDAQSLLDHQLQTYPDQPALYNIYAGFLSQNGANSEAFDKLTEGLKQFPENIELLYSRALFAEPLGKLDIVEQDLLKVIELEPDNAAALNALGYTWADHNVKLDQAFTMIEKAHKLNPDDAATMDSLGWVYYRMGNTEQAIKYLSQAFSKSPNHEIAAHLGEVLYKSGQIEEAENVWQKGYKDNPDSTILDNTIRRMKGDS